MKTILILCFLLSGFAYAECSNITLSHKEASRLISAIKKFNPKAELPDLINVECAYNGPGAGHDCHNCEKGNKKCKPCSALIPKTPNYCQVGEVRKETVAQVKELGSVLKKMKTGSQAAMGGWASQTLKHLVCHKEKSKFECTYDVCTP